MKKRGMRKWKIERSGRGRGGRGKESESVLERGRKGGKKRNEGKEQK